MTELWTFYQFSMLGAAVGLVRYGLSLPPCLGRTLIRVGGCAALVEAVLWLLRVVG